MSCCGSKRADWQSIDQPRTPQAPNGGAVYFRYWGSGSFTVTGPATGRSYRISGGGAVIAADPKDAPSLAAVPQFVQIARP